MSTPYWPLLFDYGWVDEHILNYPFPGSGTLEDPYTVGWTKNDPRDPMQFSQAARWGWTALISLATFAVALATSAYTAPSTQVMALFSVSELVFELGLSAFILGFAVGPVVWGPLSELHGRRSIFLSTYFAFTLLTAGCALAPNMEGLIIMRFLAGAFGSSPLTIAGGILADIWPNQERGLAMIFFSSAPLFGPALGPIIGGFLGQEGGWKWVQGLLAVLGGVCCLAITILLPETFALVLPARRAESLTQSKGRVYVSRLAKGGQEKALLAKIRGALFPPWVLLAYEPIVLLLTIYMAILYGTLYLFFAAFPIVYQEHRGWSQSIGGLSFLGLAIGIATDIIVAMQITIRSTHRSKPDDERCVAISIGLFWFAWTNSPSLHWLISIAAQVPFGFGFVLVYISIQNYLVDAYTIYSASVLAANAMLSLGIHWASCIPAFLALACLPFPFLFYHYGERIRQKCRFAAEVVMYSQQLRDH
ncbi:bicyclomycin resistance protein [Stachybotrys elegans]|uniref:Bicyclomycin resistance protein n=1 Tax=Stachybotrys elegans TaxID=80388 RepID=A0A8K0SKR8_9HYPO|nr:bicyclomycin resistance protein [Stachybotrys elegans]